VIHSQKQQNLFNRLKQILNILS